MTQVVEEFIDSLKLEASTPFGIAQDKPLRVENGKNEDTSSLG